MKKIILTLFIFLTSYVAAEEEYLFCGRHLLASYYDCEKEALSDFDGIKDAMSKAVEACGASILEVSDFKFTPDGYTLVMLLSESHASIHTYPEFGHCFVDLFTCGDSCDAEIFDEIMSSYLKPQNSSKQLIKRS